MSKKEYYILGLKDDIPVALVYLAVSFSFGMIAYSSELSIMETSIMSLTNLTSAGQFASLSIIGSNGSLIELALSQLVINLRYSLMSLSLSQKLKKEESILYRFIIACGVTDEMFALSISKKERISAFYNLGMMSLSIPCWVFGTFLGALFGNILPSSIVSCLSMSIYAMFIGIIIPPSKNDKRVRFSIILAIIISSMFYYLPVFNRVSSGFSIIISTVLTSLICAFKFKGIKDE